MSDSKIIPFHDLPLSTNQPFAMMTAPDDKPTFDQTCVYVGIMPNQCIILTPAKPDFPKPIIGQKVIVRTTATEGTGLFVSKVEAISSAPALLIFLKKPPGVKFVANQAIGSQGFMLPILASNESNHVRGVTGTLDGVTLQQARLTLDNVLGDPDQQIIIKGKFIIGRVNKMVSINAYIREYQGTVDDQHRYIIQFNEEDKDTFLILFGFIFREMQ